MMAQCHYSNRQYNSLGILKTHIICFDIGEYVMPFHNKLLCEYHFKRWLKKKKVIVDISSKTKKGNIKVVILKA